MKKILTIPVGEMAVIGKLALIDCPNGDSYCGEIVEHKGNRIVLTAYSVWYEGETDPDVSTFGDETITLTTTDETVIRYL